MKKYLIILFLAISIIACITTNTGDDGQVNIYCPEENCDDYRLESMDNIQLAPTVEFYE